MAFGTEGDRSIERWLLVFERACRCRGTGVPEPASNEHEERSGHLHEAASVTERPTGTTPVKLLLKLLTFALVVMMLSTSALAFEQPQSDQDIARAIVQECLAIYHERRPCACPEDHAHDGSLCGRRSAYNRPGGAEPKCYVSDVSPGEIADYRAGRKTFTSACEAVR
jgi:hypothetical protein